jgi:predicted alpha/beta-fold hydrolase
LPRYIVSTRIAGVIDRVRTPLLLISSEDDPAVASEAFREVTAAAAGNPWVLSVETPEGGHFGFDVPYGAGYLEDLIELMLSPRVLASWTAAPR